LLLSESVRASELNSTIATEAPEPISPFMNALAPFRTSSVALAVAIDVDSSSTRTTRASQPEVNPGFPVTGLIVKFPLAVPPLSGWVHAFAFANSLTVTVPGVGVVSGSVTPTFRPDPGLTNTVRCPDPLTSVVLTQVSGPLPI
jgi:hypothetical protein